MYGNSCMAVNTKNELTLLYARQSEDPEKSSAGFYISEEPPPLSIYIGVVPLDLDLPPSPHTHTQVLGIRPFLSEILRLG